MPWVQVRRHILNDRKVADAHLMRFYICYLKMQSDISPKVPPPGELDNTYASSLILARSLHCVKTLRHPQNRKYICIAVGEGPSHGHG